MAVKKAGKAVITGLKHVGQVQVNLSPSLLRYAQRRRLRVTAKSQAMQI